MNLEKEDYEELSLPLHSVLCLPEILRKNINKKGYKNSPKRVSKRKIISKNRRKKRRIPQLSTKPKHKANSNRQIYDMTSEGTSCYNKHPEYNQMLSHADPLITCLINFIQFQLAGEGFHSCCSGANRLFQLALFI